MEEVGFIKSIRDFLIHLDGLPTVKINDLIANEEGTRAWVSALESDRVEALLLDEGTVAPGQLFKRLGERLQIPVGNFLLGRSINPLGIPIDGKGPLSTTKTGKRLELDRNAPGIEAREFINKQLLTGITLVDTLIPIGRGQRELIIGDARSGKTDFLVDVIVNQKEAGVTCVYASIGKPIAEVRGLIDLLEQNDALSHTVIVAASSTDLAPLIFLTPQTAFSIAEHFQKEGQNVLVILDDMGNHAKIYREISLLSNKAPGRESYPGDIFYQHSHLLERAGNFKPAPDSSDQKGGSITALPVIELNLNDFTTFIPTNLMSMTDGHLLFRSSLYNQGQRPAIDIPLSVSRVGQQTQNRVQNFLATHIKQVLAQASGLETLSRFSFELPAETQLILKQQAVFDELIKQPALTNIAPGVQTALLTLPFTSYIRDKDSLFIRQNLIKLIKIFTTNKELAAVAQELLEIKTEAELVAKLEGIVGTLNTLLPSPAKPPVQPVTQPPSVMEGGAS